MLNTNELLVKVSGGEGTEDESSQESSVTEAVEPEPVKGKHKLDQPEADQPKKKKKKKNKGVWKKSRKISVFLKQRHFKNWILFFEHICRE